MFIFLHASRSWWRKKQRRRHREMNNSVVSMQITLINILPLLSLFFFFHYSDALFSNLLKLLPSFNFYYLPSTTFLIAGSFSFLQTFHFFPTFFSPIVKFLLNIGILFFFIFPFYFPFFLFVFSWFPIDENSIFALFFQVR